MVRHGLKHIFQKPTPDIDSSDRTQQLRSKTIYAGTVNLAQTLVKGNNSLYKTYNGPYEVVTDAGNSNLIASRSYDDLLSITKGKVLLNQLPLNSASQDYYQQNFAKGQMYEGNYNQFDPSFNFYDSSCNNSVLVYDISNNGFTGPTSYNAIGGYIGVTGPGPTGISASNKHIFIDPNHCYYSDPCLLDASYTRFVDPVLSGLTGSGPFTAQQIISADQYRGFRYPMPNFNLTCSQQLPNQAIGPIFCPPTPPTLSNFNIPSKNYGASSFQITPPSSNSSGAFTYSSSNTSVATIVGDTITIVGAGSSQITALQAASTIYASGSITTTFTVNPTSPNLSSFNIPSKIFGDSPFQIPPPSSTSTGAFTYSSSNTSVATIAGNVITIVGVGSSQITAFQAATTNYTSGSIPTTFTVNTPSIVAVGSGSNTIIYSSDGMNWFPSTNGNTMFNTGAGVAWNGTDRWVAVGGPLANSITTSTDGISWIPSGNGGLSSGGTGVAYNGSNLWVAVGAVNNTITTSTDGTSWTGRGNLIFDAGYGVAWNGSIWVAVGFGTNTIATSTDGISWTGRGASIFTVNEYGDGGRSVAWSSSLSLWVAVGVGTANTIATSTDGINWTGLSNTIFTIGGNGVAWNGNRWVAVGSGTNTIATSTDGINWTGLGNTIFSTAGYGVVWNSSSYKWIAVGSGTNSIATSSDGMNWHPSINGNSFFTTGLGIASK
jgi:hypothetical protein